MSKLLLKTFFLLISVLIINLLVRATMPYFWHRPALQSCLETLKNNPSGYDVLFLGSSKTRLGVNPTVFSNTIKKTTGKKVKSLNFSVGGASAGELYGIYQQVMAVPDFKADYIFLELRDLMFAKRNLHTNQVRYWLNWDSFHFIKNLTLHKSKKEIGLAKKLEWMWYYGLSYIENLFNTNMFPSFINSFINYKSPNLQMIGHAPRKGQNKRFRANILKVQRNINKRAHTSNKYFGNSKPFQENFNSGYYEELLQIIDDCAKRDIRLIVWIPPLITPNRLRTYKSIYRQLPKPNKMQFTVAKKYPKLYEYEFCYDHGHLNHKGSRYFSKILAKEFITFSETYPPLDMPKKRKKKRPKKRKKKRSKKRSK